MTSLVVEAPADELAPLRTMCRGQVARCEEGGLSYIVMRGLKFPVVEKTVELDALLSLKHPNATYPTRLYLAKNIGHGLNWNDTVYILGQAWYTWSWKDVPAGRPPIAILASHLGAFLK